MSRTLFRKEVLDAKRRQSLGTISLAQPVRAWLLTASAAGAALAAVLFLVLGTYTRRSHVVGQLVPMRGVATVLAPATGVISQLDASEGGRVSNGETIAVVTVPRATVDGGDTSIILQQQLSLRQKGLQSTKQAQSMQMQAQRTGLTRQLSAARGELSKIQAEIGTRQQQVRIADETLARLNELTDENYVSKLQVKQQESTALAQRGEVQALQRQAENTRRSIAQIEQALREIPGQQQAANAALQRDLASLRQEQVETQARGRLAITAPVTGIVATQMVKPGQAVQSGEPLMSLLPGDGKLEAELLVPSRAVGFIEPGDSVLLRYQAYPYQKFGHQQGTVARVSRSALSPGELGSLIGNAQAGEPYYRVTVELARQAITAYGQQESLKPGMLLDADILGEKRRLVEWVLEPLYSLKGEVSSN